MSQRRKWVVAGLLAACAVAPTVAATGAGAEDARHPVEVYSELLSDVAVHDVQMAYALSWEATAVQENGLASLAAENEARARFVAAAGGGRAARSAHAVPASSLTKQRHEPLVGRIALRWRLRVLQGVHAAHREQRELRRSQLRRHLPRRLAVRPAHVGLERRRVGPLGPRRRRPGDRGAHRPGLHRARPLPAPRQPAVGRPLLSGVSRAA